MPQFKLVSEYSPKGDQPQAIEKTLAALNGGQKELILLGGTGTGKTYTMAQVIEKLQRPTLVIAPNKTLAAQLAGEFKEFFPENAVEYFVSFYDYYQPEAYIPRTDTFIEKDALRNDEIEKLRHSATMALFERRDVIVVASVSCIYGLGSPQDYSNLVVSLRAGSEYPRQKLLRDLVKNQYTRNDIDFQRSNFRVRGDVVEIYPTGSTERAIRVEFWGDEIERLREIDVLTGEILGDRQHVAVYPASHYVIAEEKLEKAIKSIEKELKGRLSELRAEDKLLEAQRLEQRARYDLEMMSVVGFCSGIENYSRHLTGRAPGEPPYTLLDFFPDDYLVIIDESHVSVPQIGGMYRGDRARKETLVEHGFRLPSALDNRPLTFTEFTERVSECIYVSATPGSYELTQCHVAEHYTSDDLEGNPQIVQQVVRPTGLLDPQVEVRPIDGQIDDLLGEIQDRVRKEQRVLVTTLTKRMAEDLTDYFREAGIKVRYLHSEIDTLERMELIRDLRLGVFDVLVGINLLREGLDLPEVSLVAILDADKEGFLRSERSLIQMIGRAARNVDGTVIMYADRVTNSMQRAIAETDRRRTLQEEYNQKHNITPQTIRKAVRKVIEATKHYEAEGIGNRLTEVPKKDIPKFIKQLRKEMAEAAKNLEFERAASLRDMIIELEGRKV